MSVETAQPEASGITPEERWWMFLGYLRAFDRHAFVLVRSAQKEFVDGCLSLTVKFNFYKKMLSYPVTYSHLRDAVQSTYGNNAKITIEVVDHEQD
jgi:hypothetical protein